MSLSEQTTAVMMQRFHSLPDDLQALIINGELDYYVETATSEYSLADEQKNLLSNELLLTFLATEPLQQLPKNLLTNVGLAEETAIKIIKSLAQSPLRPLLVFAASVVDNQSPEGDLSLILGNGRSKSKQDFLNEEMIKKYNILPEKSANFTETIDSIVFGFKKIAELPYLLQTEVGLSPEAARQLTSELIDAWEPVVLREETEMQTKKDSVASLADKIAAIKPAATPIASTITSEGETIAPVAFEAVKPMRTMQSDIDDKKPVHGYGALSNLQTETHTDEPVIKATSFEDLRLKL